MSLTVASLFPALPFAILGCNPKASFADPCIHRLMLGSRFSVSGFLTLIVN